MTGAQIIAMRDAMATVRSPLESHWDELSAHFMPFRLASGAIPDIPSAKYLFDSTARNSALVLANGLASLIIPREEVWFEYSAPKSLENDDEAVRFYRKASETIRQLLEAANFYEEMQEALIESPVYGTSALFIGDVTPEGELYFRHLPVKTYFIGEDAQGRVNRVVRELTYTPTQAAEEFGEENLPQKIRSKVSQPEGATDTHKFIHAVYKRNVSATDPEAPASSKKPWASTIVCAESKEIIVDSGYDEFAFAVHRYRRFGTIPYGFGPGSYAIGDARQLELLNELADVATEKAIFPPVIAPSSLEGEIGVGAGEITYVDPNDPNSAAILREWATSARYDIAKDRMQDKRMTLEKAFHVDLFQLFSARARDKQPMTATEAHLVASEKLTQFSPTFGRLVSEMLDPILVRIFGVTLRAGLLGQIPPSILGPQGIAAPSVGYKNSIMLAMQERANHALLNFMNLIGPLVQVDPTSLDALNVPVAVRQAARNSGLSEDIIRSEKDIKAMQAARAEAQQAQQAAAMAEQAASAAGKLGNAPAALQAASSASLLPT